MWERRGGGGSGRGRGETGGGRSHRVHAFSSFSWISIKSARSTQQNTPPKR